MAEQHVYCEQCGDCIACDPECWCFVRDRPTPLTLYLVGKGEMTVTFPVPCKVVIDGVSRCLLERGHSGGHVLT